ncbi:deoxyuridine 5'-triphosphate nucleotidohydrolase [Halobacterium zhouii]|uniref:deoxyuridine 5'-triphosphate nucleotidohydrolase n=1 Tax=Halobacterium zhouii TaxID=2902624 RepID=UPI001E50CEC5|nr:deoxyuridine 5'-triphosphate nucleotidohydrolase [Halobacterium zhouii]
MYASGAFVAEHVESVADEQVQPNGVDLTVETVLEQREPGRITRDGKTIGERQALQPEERDTPHEDGGEQWREDAETFYLPPGGYILQYAETISVPDDHVGFLYPRSSLMRNSCMLNTAVWDAGYTGKGEGLLQVHHDVELERGARVAQFVLAEADHDEVYDGDYQNERTE